MRTVTTVAEVRAQVAGWRTAGERVAFVPTMGNLHAGHISLIELARRHGERFVASIFVNPMQFGPNEDFAHYPRTPARDAQMLAGGRLRSDVPARCGRDVSGTAPQARHAGRGAGDLGRSLCGEFRPGHFEGVATVVAKLFNIVQPDVAVFGEKDFQQLTVIRRMTADLCFPTTIIGAPTVREADGLAMSSRNQYLTATERAVAPQIHAALLAATRAIAAGESADFAAIERDGAGALATAGFQRRLFHRALCG